MLEQAAKDFRHALDSGYLPKKLSLGDRTNLAHCTEAAALGYLGKTYLFQKKYAEAAETLDKIIDGGCYALYDGAYEDIIKAPSNWSDEGIFEINCPPNQTDATAPQLMSYVYIYAGWREDFFDFSSMKPGFDNFNTTGYGFFNPQGKLVDALIKSDGANGYRTTSVVKDQTYVQDVMGIAKKANAPAHGHGLYCGWKNRYEWSDVAMNWGGWSPFPATNFRFMRYAEVLLRAAEAHFLSDSPDKALDYVNRVRTRAQAPLYTSIDMDKIKLECQVELLHGGPALHGPGALGRRRHRARHTGPEHRDARHRRFRQVDPRTRRPHRAPPTDSRPAAMSGCPTPRKNSTRTPTSSKIPGIDCHTK